MRKQLALIGLCSLVLSFSPTVLGARTVVLAEETSKPKQNVLINTLNKESKEIKDLASKNGLLPSVLMALWVRNTDFGLNPSAFSISE